MTGLTHFRYRLKWWAWPLLALRGAVLAFRGDDGAGARGIRSRPGAAL